MKFTYEVQSRALIFTDEFVDRLTTVGAERRSQEGGPVAGKLAGQQRQRAEWIHQLQAFGFRRIDCQTAARWLQRLGFRLPRLLAVVHLRNGGNLRKICIKCAHLERSIGFYSADRCAATHPAANRAATWHVRPLVRRRWAWPTRPLATRTHRWASRSSCSSRPDADRASAPDNCRSFSRASCRLSANRRVRSIHLRRLHRRRKR